MTQDNDSFDSYLQRKKIELDPFSGEKKLRKSEEFDTKRKESFTKQPTQNNNTSVSESRKTSFGENK